MSQLPRPFTGGRGAHVPVPSFLSTGISSPQASHLPPWYGGSGSTSDLYQRLSQNRAVQLGAAASWRSSDFGNAFQSESPWDKGYAERKPSDRSYSRSGFDSLERHGRQSLYCDTCNRGFRNAEELDDHVAMHVKCSFGGCKFRAHPKVVELHQKMQHSTGLAEKIMCLDTPEDIRRWREERKRNYPTADNIERKKKEQAEKHARGEDIQNKFFGKMRQGGRNNQRQDGRNGQRQDGQNGQLHHAKNGRGRRRNRNRGKKRPLNEKTDGNNIGSCTQASTAVLSTEVSAPAPTTMPPTKATLSLSSSTATAPSASTTAIAEPPSITTTSILAPISSPSETVASSTASTCTTTGACLDAVDSGKLGSFWQGNLCNDSDEERQPRKSPSPVQMAASTVGGSLSLLTGYGSGSETNTEDEGGKSCVDRPFFSRPIPDLFPTQRNRQFGRRNLSLLEKLLAGEIRHERNVILQCVYHTVRKNFFDK